MNGRWLAVLCGALLMTQAQAAAPVSGPVISLIIDDLGDRRLEGNEVATLPGPVACAILPATPYGVELARAAHAQGKEVLLHFPLQPLAGKAHPQAITMRSDRGELAQRLRADLDALPFLSGVNTHQGSLLTQQVQPMHWLMAELKNRGGLYFVDSVTTPHSVALRTAQSWGLAASRRDVFLDDSRDPAEIRAQLARLVLHARRNGSALGIGHPYAETIAVLRQELPRLATYGVRLIAPSELIALQAASPREALEPENLAVAAPVPEYQPLLLRLSTGLGSAGTTLSR